VNESREDPLQLASCRGLRDGICAMSPAFKEKIVPEWHYPDLRFLASLRRIYFLGLAIYWRN
jgi:hypothetical protein